MAADFHIGLGAAYFQCWNYSNAEGEQQLTNWVSAGSHIETRALALLRKLQAVSEKSSKVERARPSRLSGRKRGASAMSERYNEDIAERCCPLTPVSKAPWLETGS